MEEVLHEIELAQRMGCSIEQVRKWAKEGKFSKNVALKIKENVVYIKRELSDTVKSLEKVNQFLDEMQFIRGASSLESAVSFAELTRRRTKNNQMWENRE